MPLSVRRIKSASMEQGGGRSHSEELWDGILLSCAEELKTPREKEQEKELLESYLNTVNDRNNIVDCLDEDRIR